MPKPSTFREKTGERRLRTRLFSDACPTRKSSSTFFSARSEVVGPPHDPSRRAAEQVAVERIDPPRGRRPRDDPPELAEGIIPAPAQVAELGDAVDPEARVVPAEHLPQVRVDRAEALQPGRRPGDAQRLPRGRQGESDRLKLAVDHGFPRQGDVSLEPDFPPQALGRDLVGERLRVRPDRGVNLLGRQALHGQVGGREPPGGVQGQDPRGDPELDLAVGLAGQLQTLARNRGRQECGVEAADRCRALGRLPLGEGYARFGRDPAAERPGLDAGEGDRVTLGRPPEGDVAERHRARREPAEAALALRLDRPGGQGAPHLGPGAEGPGSGRRPGGAGDQGERRGEVPVGHVEHPLKRSRRLQADVEPGVQGLAVELGRECGDLELPVLQLGPGSRRRPSAASLVSDPDAPGLARDGPRLRIPRRAQVALGLDVHRGKAVERGRPGQDRRPELAERQVVPLEPGGQPAGWRKLGVKRSAEPTRWDRALLGNLLRQRLGGIVGAAVGTIGQPAAEVLQLEQPLGQVDPGRDTADVHLVNRRSLERQVAVEGVPLQVGQLAERDRGRRLQAELAGDRDREREAEEELRLGDQLRHVDVVQLDPRRERFGPMEAGPGRFVRTRAKADPRGLPGGVERPLDRHGPADRLAPDLLGADHPVLDDQAAGRAGRVQAQAREIGVGLEECDLGAGLDGRLASPLQTDIDTDRPARDEVRPDVLGDERDPRQFLEVGREPLRDERDRTRAERGIDRPRDLPGSPGRVVGPAREDGLVADFEPGVDRPDVHLGTPFGSENQLRVVHLDVGQARGPSSAPPKRREVQEAAIPIEPERHFRLIENQPARRNPTSEQVDERKVGRDPRGRGEDRGIGAPPLVQGHSDQTRRPAVEPPVAEGDSTLEHPLKPAPDDRGDDPGADDEHPGERDGYPDPQTFRELARDSHRWSPIAPLKAKSWPREETPWSIGVMTRERSPEIRLASGVGRASRPTLRDRRPSNSSALVLRTFGLQIFGESCRFSS